MKPRELSKELVVGFGFLSGLWLKYGLDPQEEIFKALFSIFDILNFHNLGIDILKFTCLHVLPLIAAVGSLLYAYEKGGTLACIAIGIAFIGGLFYPNGTVMIILLIVGFLVGVVAFSMHGSK